MRDAEGIMLSTFNVTAVSMFACATSTKLFKIFDFKSEVHQCQRVHSAIANIRLYQRRFDLITHIYIRYALCFSGILCSIIWRVYGGNHLIKFGKSVTFERKKNEHKFKLSGDFDLDECGQNLGFSFECKRGQSQSMHFMHR